MIRSMRLLGQEVLHSRHTILGLSGQASIHSFVHPLPTANHLISVIAFKVHVLKWTLDDSPPDEYARCHIKEASFYGQDT